MDWQFVEKDGKSGVIDTLGNIIIPLKYASIFGSPGETGYYGVELSENGNKEYLRADGKPFTSHPIKHLYSRNGHGILPFSDQSNKYGYLNADGTVFISAKFDKANPFSEGQSWVVGDVSSLKIAANSNDQNFVREYIVGEKIQSKKNGQGAYFPGTVQQTTDYYYLILFSDGSQEWVVFDSLKR